MSFEYKSKIEREEVNTLPVFTFEGPVVVIEDPKQVDECVERISAYPKLGFDTETKPAFKKGVFHKVCLIQIATEEEVYLFRINKCGFQPSLEKLLEDDRIMKIGVGVKDDVVRLKKLKESFEPGFFLDLQDFVEKFGIRDKSFSKLMAIIFNVKISKRQQVTNWEAFQLTEAQVRYAATDAWGALQMYLKLTSGDDSL